MQESSVLRARRERRERKAARQHLTKAHPTPAAPSQPSSNLARAPPPRSNISSIVPVAPPRSTDRERPAAVPRPINPATNDNRPVAPPTPNEHADKPNVTPEQQPQKSAGWTWKEGLCYLLVVLVFIYAASPPSTGHPTTSTAIHVNTAKITQAVDALNSASSVLSRTNDTDIQKNIKFANIKAKDAYKLGSDARQPLTSIATFMQDPPPCVSPGLLQLLLEPASNASNNVTTKLREAISLSQTAEHVHTNTAASIQAADDALASQRKWDYFWRGVTSLFAPNEHVRNMYKHNSQVIAAITNSKDIIIQAQHSLTVAVDDWDDMSTRLNYALKLLRDDSSKQAPECLSAETFDMIRNELSQVWEAKVV